MAYKSYRLSTSGTAYIAPPSMQNTSHTSDLAAAVLALVLIAVVLLFFLLVGKWGPGARR